MSTNDEDCKLDRDMDIKDDISYLTEMKRRLKNETDIYGHKLYFKKEKLLYLQNQYGGNYDKILLIQAEIVAMESNINLYKANICDYDAKIAELRQRITGTNDERENA